jgi:hypothetical protein
VNTFVVRASVVFALGFVGWVCLELHHNYPMAACLLAGLVGERVLMFYATIGGEAARKVQEQKYDARRHRS